MSLEPKPPWGYHLILDMSTCDPFAVADGDTIRNMVTTLVEGVGMVAYGPMQLEHFAEHLPDAAGYTVVQLIETSAISGHFSDNNHDAYLDIFSCQYFNKDLAIKIVRDFMQPMNIRWILVEREAKRKIENRITQGTIGAGYGKGDPYQESLSDEVSGD